MGLVLDVLLELVLEGREPEEEMGARSHHRSPFAEHAVPINEVLGVEYLPALIALVPSGAHMAAVRAGPFHVPVREVPAAVLAVGERHIALVDVPLLPEVQHEVLDHLQMRRMLRVQEEIEAQPEPLEAPQVDFVEAIRYHLGLHSLLFRADRGGRSVHVRTGDHQDVVSLHPVISSEYVGREIAPRHSSDVNDAVSIRPSDADEYPCHISPIMVIGFKTEVRPMGKDNIWKGYRAKGSMIWTLRR